MAQVMWARALSTTPPPRATTVAGRFRALPASQRVLLGVFGMCFSAMGLMFSNGLERKHEEREAMKARLEQQR